MNISVITSQPHKFSFISNFSLYDSYILTQAKSQA